MEREGRFSQWLRRRSRSADNTAAQAAHVREELVLASAAAGFPLAPAAYPEGYGCSCERIGCPTPGLHPVSFAWQTQATTDPEQVTRWVQARPQANFITATGLIHDVLDVPFSVGRVALERLENEGVDVGPVAAYAADRMLFFTTTRGTPEDEDEWWPCELDCHPETMDEHPGLRWHCRGSYVLLPPSRLELTTDASVSWLRAPERPLPDPLTLLEALTDAGVAHAAEQPEYEGASWPSR